MLPVNISYSLKSVFRYKFLIWLPTIRTLFIYVNKDVRITGHFSKPKGAREQRIFGDTVLA